MDRPPTLRTRIDPPDGVETERSRSGDESVSDRSEWTGAEIGAEATERRIPPLALERGGRYEGSHAGKDLSPDRIKKLTNAVNESRVPW